MPGTMTAALSLKNSQSPLRGPILAFLLEAAAEMPEEVWPALGLPTEAAETLRPALAASPRALARLSCAYSQTSYGGEPAWLPYFLAADFSALPARLLLLPPQALLALGRYAGLTLYCREAAGLLRREDVLALKEAFGPASRDFAVRRAPFLLHEPGRLAGILGGTLKGDQSALELISLVNRAARAALAVCAGALAPPLARLFLARLPQAAAPPSLDEAAWYSLQALLRKLLAREAELKPWAALS